MHPPRAPRLAAGALVQHYEVIRRLGKGGMGTVYLARDTRLGRLVALKLLTRHTGEYAARFLREARATAQLAHENIVVIHDLGEHDGTPYMVLEHLQGKTFEQMLRERQERAETDPDADPDETLESVPTVGLPPGRAVELMIPVVRALACAHEHGIIHRDLNPSNVLWTDAGIVKVLDFGLAKHVGPLPSAPVAEGRSRTAEDGPTAEGVRLGTKAYMSPEQWLGGRVDHRADLWAAGLLLAELVLGRHLLAPLSVLAMANVQLLDVPMPSLRELRPDLGKLGSIVDRCLLKRAADRIGSARELSAELEALLPTTRAALPNDEEQNPYVGLSAFQPSDAGRFFGRTAAVARIVARIAEQPLLAIVGPSGAGKSSFVRAGVIPALERGGEAWDALVLRPGEHPLVALARLLPAEARETAGGDETGRAREAPTLNAEREALAVRLHAEPGLLGARLRALAHRRLKRVLLFVDQLEELFTLAPEAARRAFLSCLAGAADDAGSPLRVVLAIRSDFLDRLAEEGAALHSLHRGILLLPPMDRDGLREALIRPLEAVEHRFEPPSLVDEMLDALPHTAAALPLLSFTAARLWEQRDRVQHALTEESYRRLGGLGGALSGHADAVLGAMSAEEQKLARAVLLRLVTPERTRATAAMSELRQLGTQAPDVERVLARLIDARLLAVEGSSDAEATVELSHESLIVAWPALSEWLSENQEDAAFLSRLRDAARVWEAGHRSDDLLWRGQVLEAARLWRTRYTGTFAQGEERFLQASIRLAARARRLRRWITLGAFVALSLIAVGVSLLAALARRAALREREEATRAAEQAARADQEAVRAQGEARQARNATRMAAARERVADPTTVLAILREIEPPGVPRGWAALSRWALGAGVAQGVFLHPDAIYSAAWSPDGKRFATASFDKTARVWSADGAGQPIVLRGHEDRVNSVAWSPDGTHVLTSSFDKTARVWSADGAGQPIVLRGHENHVYSAAFSPDGKHIVTASWDKTARVWSADGTDQPIVLRGHEAGVIWAAWSPDGERILTASRDKTARVWSADGTGQPIVFRGHDDHLYSAAWSPDGKRIATASWDKTARMWNADGTGQPIVLRGHDDGVYSVVFSPDGKHVITTSWDKTARVWNADGTGLLFVLRGHEDTIYSAAWSPDGKRILTASTDKTARVWSADRTGQPIVLHGHESPVYSAAWSPDGKRIVTTSDDKTARIWNADGTGQPLVLRGHEHAIPSAAWSPDSKRIVTASLDKTVRVWSADGTGQPIVLRGHEDTVYGVAWSPDGKRIVTASWDKTARVWNANGAGQPLILEGHEARLTRAAWSPDSKRIATASWDKTARVWNADGTGEPIVLHGHEDVVRSVAWSPDGKRIVTACLDKTARVWNADGTGEPLVLRGHEHWVHSAAFSPDGRRIFTASIDKTVRVWNADGTGEPVVLSGAAGGYNYAAWSPDGTSIAAPSNDHTVWVWTDLEPIRGVDDPKLWTATTYCPPIETRVLILGVPEATAADDQAACLRRVDAARAAPP